MLDHAREAVDMIAGKERDVIGMRNRLVHGYDSVDLDVLWDTVELDLPPLITELEK